MATKDKNIYFDQYKFNQLKEQALPYDPQHQLEPGIYQLDPSRINEEEYEPCPQVESSEGFLKVLVTRRCRTREDPLDVVVIVTSELFPLKDVAAGVRIAKYLGRDWYVDLKGIDHEHLIFPTLAQAQEFMDACEKVYQASMNSDKG
jgi:hypothetical protein